MDDPDNDLIDFGRSLAGETVLLKRLPGDRTQWVLEERVEQQANKVEAMTEPDRKEYNGWSTYETWATGMFLDGNYTGEGTYREVQQMTTRLTRGLDENSTGDEIVAARDELAVELQAYVVDHFASTMPEGSPVSMEGDLLATRWGRSTGRSSLTTSSPLWRSKSRRTSAHQPNSSRMRHPRQRASSTRRSRVSTRGPRLSLRPSSVSGTPPHRTPSTRPCERPMCSRMTSTRPAAWRAAAASQTI